VPTAIVFKPVDRALTPTAIEPLPDARALAPKAEALSPVAWLFPPVAVLLTETGVGCGLRLED
jgi:hypothetical protein